MKHHLSVFLFFLLGFSLFAQNVEQHISQLARLDKKHHKTEKDIAEMLSLCKNIYTLEPDLVLNYLGKLKPVIEQKKYYHGWEDYSFLVLDIYRGKGQLQEAEKQINEIYDRYAYKFTPEDKVSIRADIAQMLLLSEETERSLEIVEEILPEAQTDFQKALLYHLRAGANQRKGNYKQAVTDCLNSIDLYKSTDNHKNISICYGVLSNVYKDMNDYNKALAYAKEGLAWAKKTGHYMSEIDISNQIGVYYRGLKQIDSALHYYNRGIEQAKKHNRTENLAQNLLNMANIYSDEKKDYAQAEKYYRQSLDICYASNMSYGIYINWLNLGNNYRLKKEYVLAKKACDSAWVYAEMLKIPSEEASVHQGYYELYKDKGDFQKALLHHEKFNEINQSLNLGEQQKEIAELQAKYDIAVKDREIERINNENMKYRFRNRILFLIVVSGILGMGSLTYFMNYRNKSLRKLYERNVELAKSSFVVETSEAVEEDKSPLKKVFDQLVAVMEDEKIYIEPTLSVDSVTQKLQTNKKYLSNSIAVYAKDNFNNFVNSYRIQEARRIILQKPSLSLNEVMYACGFNSRTPFYTAFQKNTGMSPQQFKELSKSSTS